MPHNTAPPGQLDVHSFRRGPIEVVSAAGDVDLATASRLQKPLMSVLAHHPAGLVLDMTEVTFFGSKGVHLLLLARHWAVDNGSPFATACSPVVDRVLSLTGMASVIDHHPSVDEAATALSLRLPGPPAGRV